MYEMKLSTENENEVIDCVNDVIKGGGVAILPTDTVYALAADALNENAVKRIYELKKRELSKPCNILVSDIQMIRYVTEGISEKEEEIIKKYFPRSSNNNF